MDIFRLTNEELWRGLKALAARERGMAADAVAYVAETQRRRLHEDHGWRSMFEYCVQSLRWSEATAYRRTRAANAVIACPAILEMLYDGRLHVEGVVILAAFLTESDFSSLLLKAAGKTVKEIEWLVADRRRDPPVRDSIRFVGVAPPPVKAVEVPAVREFPPSRPPEVPSPIAIPSPTVVPPSRPPDGASRPRLVRVGFTADEDLHRLVLHAQQLMRHKYPDGSLEGIFRDALLLLIAKKDLGVRAAAAAAARRLRRKNNRESNKLPP